LSIYNTKNEFFRRLEIEKKREKVFRNLLYSKIKNNYIERQTDTSKQKN